jgi:hypothetical protein
MLVLAQTVPSFSALEDSIAFFRSLNHVEYGSRTLKEVEGHFLSQPDTNSF